MPAIALCCSKNGVWIDHNRIQVSVMFSRIPESNYLMECFADMGALHDSELYRTAIRAGILSEGPIVKL